MPPPSTNPGAPHDNLDLAGRPRRRSTDRIDALKGLATSSEMAERIAAFDWKRTPLGPMEEWPISLRTILAMLLENKFPMTLFWGPNLYKLYNDAYVPVLGGKHPGALGQPGAVVWSEIWPILGPQTDLVMAGQGATWNEHLLLPMVRKGFREETYFTFSYSPVRDDAGSIGGVLVTCQETTVQVQSERQLQLLRELGAQGFEGQSVEAACRGAARILAQNDADIPFALLYLLREGGRAELVASAGMDGYEGPGLPMVIPIDHGDEGWPLASARRPGGFVVVRDLGARFGAMPGGRWHTAPSRAVILSLAGSEQSEPYGFWIAGVNPLRVLDERYKRMFQLTRDQIVAAIGSARAFEEQRTRVQALAALDRAKTTFFSNVSHEFRTPLMLMLGPIEDLLAGMHGPLAPEHKAQLELLHRNALRLNKLVNSLLDFSRLEAGRIQASYEPVDLAALTRDFASSFRSAIERAGLALVVDCPPLGEPIFVDRDMYEKIVLNLISNALKFTFEGRIHVSLRSAGGAVALRIEDTGVGIPPEEMPRLFERFSRVEGARSRTHEGSGIGLALVQELTKLHGGSVQVESSVGCGTTFTVTIPTGSAHLPANRIGAARTLPSTSLGAAPFVEEALRWLPAGEAPRHGSELSRDGENEQPAQSTRAVERAARVLFVDDNADMRDYVRRLLEPHLTVEVAADGAQALAAVEQRPPDLILTDVMMPRVDGFELVRRLRARESTRAIPVVMVSARAGEEASIEGLHAGADDYLTKPFSARELLARVQTQLERARAQKAAQSEREARIAEMERAVRFGELLAGVVGHDLRNPLSAITTTAGRLARRADSEGIVEPMRRMLASAQRMDRMIAQLLDVTRLRLQGGLPLERSRVDLAEMSRFVIDELEPVYAREIRLRSGGEVVGMWDRDRLSQMLSNLAANACQHGAPDVPVNIVLDGQQPHEAIITIHNGGAIPAEVLPVLFEPLHQTGTSPYAWKKGSGSSGLGLGLYITQQIVLAHGGTISFESSEAAGTSFIVRLPRA